MEESAIEEMTLDDIIQQRRQKRRLEKRLPKRSDDSKNVLDRLV